MKPSALLLNTTTFTGRPSCDKAEKIAHQHGESAVARQRDHLPARKRRLCADRCGIALAIEPCQNDPISRRLPFIAR